MDVSTSAQSRQKFLGCPLKGLLFTCEMSPMLNVIECEVGNNNFRRAQACADDVGAVKTFWLKRCGLNPSLLKWSSSSAGQNLLAV